MNEEKIKDWTLFFTYGEDYKYKSMAIVKANTMKEAGEKLKNTIDTKEYPNFHLWWVEELEKMYNGKNIIIP